MGDRRLAYGGIPHSVQKLKFAIHYVLCFSCEIAVILTRCHPRFELQRGTGHGVHLVLDAGDPRGCDHKVVDDHVPVAKRRVPFE